MGSGSSTKSDSAHRIEVVRGPRRTLIRLTGSFLVLLTPPPSHSLLGALLLSVRRPRFLPLPIRENVRATNIYIYIGNGCDSIDRELFFFSRLFRRGRKTRSVSVCLHKRAPPRFNSWKTFYSIVRQIWVAVKKIKKKKKERAVYREKGGGERERERVGTGRRKTIRQISLLSSRRQTFDDNCLVYLVAMGEKRIRIFEYDNSFPRRIILLRFKGTNISADIYTGELLFSFHFFPPPFFFFFPSFFSPPLERGAAILSNERWCIDEGRLFGSPLAPVSNRDSTGVSPPIPPLYLSIAILFPPHSHSSSPFMSRSHGWYRNVWDAESDGVELLVDPARPLSWLH